MTDLLVTQRPALVLSRFQRELALYDAQVQETYELHLVALDELEYLNEYAVRRFFATLEEAKVRLLHARERGLLTLAKQQDLYLLTLAYIQALTRIIENSGSELHRLLNEADRLALPASTGRPDPWR